MEFYISLTALLIALIALSYQIKDFKKKNRIGKFKGRIGIDESDETRKFSDFIFKNEGKIIHLDIYFDNDDIYEIDKDGIFEFSYFYDIKNKNFGGYAYRIEVKDSDDFFYDGRLSSKRLKGKFKIIGFSGPQQGWMTTIMKPIKIETN